MAAVINGITCEERVADFHESYDLLAGPGARKGYLCAWADRATVAKGLLGLSNTTSVGGFITLSTPAQYPENPTMYVKSIDIIPVGKPTQGTVQIQWEKAIVYANYGCLPWSFSGIDSNFFFSQIDPATPLIYCEQNIQTSTSFMTIPGFGLRTSSSFSTRLKTDFQMPIFQADIQLTFFRIPYYPAQAIFTAGKNFLNSTTFLGLDARYVMFNGSQNKGSRDTSGNFTQDITYSFSYRNIQWDYVWDTKAGGFYQVLYSGSPIMGSSDLNNLIPVGYRL